jgi:hypothetical protein
MLAERYEAGEHEAVWSELIGLGERVREPGHREDADRVVELTMKRVAANVSTIVTRLNQMGYRWARPARENDSRRRSGEPLLDEYQSIYEPPGPGIVADIARAEHAVGVLPLAVRGLFRWVGEVDLAGSMATWVPSAYMFEGPEPWPEFGVYSCPLHFYGVRLVTGYIDPETGLIHRRYLREDGRYRMYLAADELMLAGYSGGCHMIVLPDAGTDPMVDSIGRRTPMQLIEYLRLAFAWGGFPGYELAESVPDELESLRAGLLPI